MPTLKPINTADLQGVSLLKSSNDNFEDAAGHASNKRFTEAFSRVEKKNKKPLIYHNA